MTLRIVAIVQARMSSSRLPGKVMLDIQGQPMLARVVDRASRSALVNQVVVATTTDPTDDTIAAYCVSRELAFSRGSQFDVLDRYYRAARANHADVVVRITADCPLIDPGLVDLTIGSLLGPTGTDSLGSPAPAQTKFDFAANRLPPPWKRTYPIGLDTEVCTFAALERAWTEAAEPQEREHVMPYLYEGVTLQPAERQLSAGVSPKGFRVVLLDWPLDYGAYRWTVDTAEDLEFVRQVYSHLGDRKDFSWGDVLALVRAHPELMEINSSVRHKSLGDVDERAASERGK
jgi:spore coat polysaccharide biosynthesis protein SpsF